MGWGEVLLRVLWAILALAIVLFLAWFVLRWLNRRLPGTGGGGKRAIQIIDRVSAGKNAYLLLVHIQDKVILVGVSDHAFEKLYEFEDPDGEFRLPETPEGISFSAALKDAVSKMGSKSMGGKGDKP